MQYLCDGCYQKGALVSDFFAHHRIPEMVRLGKMESTHASIKAYHIDFVSGRATKEESKIASAEGIIAETILNLERDPLPILQPSMSLNELECSGLHRMAGMLFQDIVKKRPGQQLYANCTWCSAFEESEQCKTAFVWQQI